MQSCVQVDCGILVGFGPIDLVYAFQCGHVLSVSSNQLMDKILGLSSYLQDSNFVMRRTCVWIKMVSHFLSVKVGMLCFNAGYMNWLGFKSYSNPPPTLLLAPYSTHTRVSRLISLSYFIMNQQTSYSCSYISNSLILYSYQVTTMRIILNYHFIFARFIGYISNRYISNGPFSVSLS